MSIRCLLPQPDQTATEDWNDVTWARVNPAKFRRWWSVTTSVWRVIRWSAGYYHVFHFDLSVLQTLQLHKKEQLDLRSFNYWGTNRPRLCTRFIFFSLYETSQASMSCIVTADKELKSTSPASFRGVVQWYGFLSLLEGRVGAPRLTRTVNLFGLIKARRLLILVLLSSFNVQSDWTSTNIKLITPPQTVDTGDTAHMCRQDIYFLLLQCYLLLLLLLLLLLCLSSFSLAVQIHFFWYIQIDFLKYGRSCCS